MADRTDSVRSSRTRRNPHRPTVRALCCECGRMRSVDPLTRGKRVGEAGWNEDPANGRCLVTRKCGTCKRQTAHAWLRDDLEPDRRDLAERHNASVLIDEVTAPSVGCPSWCAECFRDTDGSLYHRSREVSIGRDASIHAFAWQPLGGEIDAPTFTLHTSIEVEYTLDELAELTLKASLYARRFTA